jgi:hypothetical protein
METPIVFPNGLESYLETYFEVVAFIMDDVHQAEIGVIADIEASQGRGGLYTLALKWTIEFEKRHEGRNWDGEFFDMIDEFLIGKNKL